jgi:hypothetical protein
MLLVDPDDLFRDPTWLDLIEVAIIEGTDYPGVYRRVRTRDEKDPVVRCAKQIGSKWVVSRRKLSEYYDLTKPFLEERREWFRKEQGRQRERMMLQ